EAASAIAAPEQPNPESSADQKPEQKPETSAGHRSENRPDHRSEGRRGRFDRRRDRRPDRRFDRHSEHRSERRPEGQLEDSQENRPEPILLPGESIAKYRGSAVPAAVTNVPPAAETAEAEPTSTLDSMLQAPPQESLEAAFVEPALLDSPEELLPELTHR